MDAGDVGRRPRRQTTGPFTSDYGTPEKSAIGVFGTQGRERYTSGAGSEKTKVGFIGEEPQDSPATGEDAKEANWRDGGVSSHTRTNPYHN